jgi:predicted Rossmann-fold nucleotide-binding protein
MAAIEKKGWSPLPHSDEDLERAKAAPDTPQTRAASYRLAWNDQDFLTRRELRSVRLQLELLKPEMMLAERGIRSTVILFGGARIPEPGGEAWAAKNEVQKKNLLANAKYYEEAREFARLCSQASARHDHCEYVVVTGGGPGLNFHYFAIRKMHFIMRAKAVAVFPGGFGTMDELFETLTLIQTGRMERVPVILFGKEFWEKAVNIDYLAEQGTISPGDGDLLTFVDTAAEAWKIIADFYELDAAAA